MIRLSAFADEAGRELDTQIEALKRNGISYIEVRFLGAKNVADLTEEEARAAKAKLDEAGIRVSAIGSPLGKIKITDDIDAHMEKTRHVCRLAKIFGTQRIRMFSFYEAYEAEEEVFAALRRMVAIAKEEGVTLCHENEKDIFGDVAARILRIMENVEGLAYVYDPANFLEVGEDSANALAKLHDKMTYFHIKDVIKESHEIVPAGYGDGLIDQLVSRLPAEGEWILTLEPHLALFEGYAAIDNTEMKNKFVFQSNGEAFDAAVAALKKVILSQNYKEENGGFVTA